MNDVLIISVAYPPSNTVGAFRAGRFAKYLDEYDWNVHILTDGHKYSNKKIDPAFRKSIKNPKSIHYINKTTEINDGHISWSPKMIKSALDIIDKNNVDVVLHTGGPFLPMISNRIIKSVRKIPYILDLRDPWSLQLDYSSPTSAKSYLYRITTSVAEPITFKNSDKIIMNTPVMESEYELKYPKLSDKFEVITNGFDSNIKPDPTINDASDEYQIVYPGKFYGHLEPLFEILTTLFDTYPNTKFIHLGNPDQKAVELARDFGCEDNVEFRGYVDSDEVAATLRRSNLGLALGRDITHVPMKVYDYMGCNLPVLALGPPDGALVKLVGKFDGGYTADRKNKSDIQSALFNLRSDSPSSLARPEELVPYEFKNLTAKLANVLEEATQSD